MKQLQKLRQLMQKQKIKNNLSNKNKKPAVKAGFLLVLTHTKSYRYDKKGNKIPFKYVVFLNGRL